MEVGAVVCAEEGVEGVVGRWVVLKAARTGGSGVWRGGV